MAKTVSAVRDWFAGAQPSGDGFASSNWDSSKMANAIIDAFLYEFLTLDDVDATKARINSLIEELEKDPDWEPLLTGTAYIDDPGGETAKKVKTNLRVRSNEDVVNLRKAVAANPGSDEKAYLGITEQAKYLHESAAGRQMLKAMCENWGVIVGEQYTALPDLTTTITPGAQPHGGYGTLVPVTPGPAGIDQIDLPPTQVGGPRTEQTAIDKMFKMEGVGDDGSRDVNALDFMVFLSLVNNTGLVTKGAIDHVVALKDTSTSGKSLGEKVLEFFAAGKHGLPTDLNYLQEFKSIKEFSTSASPKFVDEGTLPPRRWIPVIGLAPRYDGTETKTVYRNSSAQIVTRGEATQYALSAQGEPDWILKSGYTSRAESQKKVADPAALVGYPLQAALGSGGAGAGSSGAQDSDLNRLIPGPRHGANSGNLLQTSDNPLQDRVNKIVIGTGDRTWKINDEKDITWDKLRVKSFIGAGGPMVHYENWLKSPPPATDHKNSSTPWIVRRDEEDGQAIFTDTPTFDNGRAVPGSKWHSVYKAVQGTGRCNWDELTTWKKNKTPPVYHNKTYQDNSFSDHCYYIYVDFNKDSGTDSVASVCAYTCRIIARIARCYPKRLVSRLGYILKDILKQDVPPSGGKTALSEGEVKYKKVKVEVSGLKPYDLQCFLIENIRRLTEAKGAELQSNIDKGKRAYQNLGIIASAMEMHEQAGHPVPTSIRTATLSKNRAVQPGNILSYIQHGGPDRTPQVEALLNLCPDAYALLTPYIKLYRVDYEEGNRLRPKKETEIPFPTFIDPKDISQITSGDYGRYTGAGIKSFSWSLDGVNPAEVENNISAELELRFNTLYDLFSSNQNLQAGATDSAGYLDLIIGSGTSTRQTPVEAPKAHPRSGAGCRELQTEHYEGERFRIKATVGWSTPPGFANMNFRNFQKPMGEGIAGTYGEFLQKAIDESRTSLYLQVTGHELNFNENGTVDLRITYQAGLDGILKAPNADIFVGGAEFDQKIKDLKETLQEIETEAGVLVEDDPTGEASAAALDALSTKRIKKLEELDKLVTRNKAEKYKRFLCNLYDKSQIYMLRVPLDEIRKYEEMTPKERAELARTRLDPNDSFLGIEGEIQSANNNEIDKLILGAQSAITKAHGKKNPEDVGKKKVSSNLLNALGGKKRKGKKRSVGRLKPETLDVPYFYLGDLLDGVLTYLSNIVADDNGLQGSFQLLLANIEILDPLLAFKYPEVGVRCGPDEAITRRSLADIDPLRFKGAHQLSFYTNIGSLPISLEYFQEWFVNFIVRPQRETYSFLNFIKQLCQALIGRTFNSQCFGDALNYNLQFDTAIFGMADSYRGDIVSPQAVAASKASAERKGLTPLNLETAPDRPPIIPTLVLYSVDSRPAVSKSERENVANGIYHHYVGGSCGLTKKISFHRSDMPDLRAARLQREGSLSATQMRELYNVNIEMVGNNLHRNGQYIKVDPISIGVGPSEAQGTLPNLAQLIGIGGYYLITGVNHTINSKGFDVSVKAMQEGIDFTEGELVDIYEFKIDDSKEDIKANPDKDK